MVHLTGKLTAVEDHQNGQGTAQAIIDIFEAIFGIEIGSSDYCDDVISSNLELVDDTECRGFGISQVLIRLRRAIEAGQVPDVLYGREADTVYITGHKTIWGPFHTAIEYRYPSLLVVWFGAGPANKSILHPGGLLTSIEGRKWDHPSLSVTIGTVQRPAISAEAYFETIRAADAYYGDCLDYDGHPSGTTNTGYNSNGYVAGIILKTFGVTEVDMSGFTGGNVPVPSWYFTGSGANCGN